MAGAVHHEAVCAEVARILGEERRSRGLSMNELSVRSGLSRAMISGLEGGPSNPTLESLLRIAAVLDLPLSQILARAEAGVQQRRKR